MSTDPYWTAAAQVCTTLELQTLQLRDRGLSLRQAALAMNVSVSTIRSRLFSADRKIELALRKEPAA
jgi:DNA-directed RNA polymerase specialized sigma24 family protein